MPTAVVEAELVLCETSVFEHHILSVFKHHILSVFEHNILSDLCVDHSFYRACCSSWGRLVV